MEEKSKQNAPQSSVPVDGDGQMREAFERAMADRGYHDFLWRPNIGEYHNLFTQGQWVAWQAARSFEDRAALSSSGWQPIETAPKDGRTLLLGYANVYGKWRTLRGQWFSKAVIEETWEDDECTEGWYETSVECGDEINCWGCTPTHWMDLPPDPTPVQKGTQK